MQNVLDSIVPALLADKNRKFIYVEQASIYVSYFCFFDHPLRGLWFRKAFGGKNEISNSVCMSVSLV